MKKLLFICALLSLTSVRSQPTDSLNLHFDAGFGSSVILNSNDLILNPGPFISFGFEPIQTNSLSFGFNIGWQGGSVLNQVPIYLCASATTESWRFRFNVGTRLAIKNNKDIIDESTVIRGRESLQLEVLRKLGTGPIYLLSQLTYFRFKTFYGNQFEFTDYAFGVNLGLSIHI